MFRKKKTPDFNAAGKPAPGDIIPGDIIIERVVFSSAYNEIADDPGNVEKASNFGAKLSDRLAELAGRIGPLVNDLAAFQNTFTAFPGEMTQNKRNNTYVYDLTALHTKLSEPKAAPTTSDTIKTPAAASDAAPPEAESGAPPTEGAEEGEPATVPTVEEIAAEEAAQAARAAEIAAAEEARLERVEAAKEEVRALVESTKGFTADFEKLAGLISDLHEISADARNLAEDIDLTQEVAQALIRGYASDFIDGKTNEEKQPILFAKMNLMGQMDIIETVEALLDNQRKQLNAVVGLAVDKFDQLYDPAIEYIAKESFYVDTKEKLAKVLSAASYTPLQRKDITDQFIGLSQLQYATTHALDYMKVEAGQSTPGPAAPKP